jgi:NAD(P)-dependent dehydrogenase (short-subunit alcohol dehydrogenase family)
MKRWRDRVAVVADADRRVGMDTAIELGGAGVFVYAIGRMLKPGVGDPAGSLDETIDTIRGSGGDGHAVACDCANYNSLEQLFAEVAARHGRLDILVNSAFSTRDCGDWTGKRMWETRPQLWSEIVDLPGRAAFFATALAAPLLIASARRRAPGLIVNVSGRSARLDRSNTACGVGASAIAGLTRDAATELKPHNVAVIAIQPGSDSPDTADETARCISRCIAALAADPDRMRRTGRSYCTSTLAAEYAVDDELADLLPEHSG